MKKKDDEWYAKAYPPIDPATVKQDIKDGMASKADLDWVKMWNSWTPRERANYIDDTDHYIVDIGI